MVVFLRLFIFLLFLGYFDTAKYRPILLASRINTAAFITVLKLHPTNFFFFLFIRRTRIRRATENEFPGNSIPTFRSNPEARKRLDKLVKQLANSCSIEEVNFGEGTL